MQMLQEWRKANSIPADASQEVQPHYEEIKSWFRHGVLCTTHSANPVWLMKVPHDVTSCLLSLRSCLSQPDTRCMHACMYMQACMAWHHHSSRQLDLQLNPSASYLLIDICCACLPGQVGDMKKGWHKYKASGYTDRDISHHISFCMVQLPNCCSHRPRATLSNAVCVHICAGISKALACDASVTCAYA